MCDPVPQAQDFVQLSFSCSWLPGQRPVPKYPAAGVCWWLLGWLCVSQFTLAFPALSVSSLLPQPTHSCHCCPWGIKQEEFNCSFPPAGGSCVTQPSADLGQRIPALSVHFTVTAGLHGSDPKEKADFFLDPIWVPLLQNNPRNVLLQSSPTLLAFAVYMCCPLSPSAGSAIAPQGRRVEGFCAAKAEQKSQQKHKSMVFSLLRLIKTDSCVFFQSFRGWALINTWPTSSGCWMRAQGTSCNLHKGLPR